MKSLYLLCALSFIGLLSCTGGCAHARRCFGGGGCGDGSCSSGQCAPQTAPVNSGFYQSGNGSTAFGGNPSSPAAGSGSRASTNFGGTSNFSAAPTFNGAPSIDSTQSFGGTSNFGSASGSFGGASGGSGSR